MILEATFNTAVAHHQAGRLAEAENLYRQVLRERPGHADTIHLLGVIAHQKGRNEDAVSEIRRAIALNPASAAYHSNLGVALRALKRLPEAVDAFREACRLDSAYAVAWKNLGAALRDLGRHEEAVPHLRRALELAPHDPTGYRNLGACLMQMGQVRESVDLFARAVAMRPDDPEGLNNLGAALNDLGRAEEAETHLRKALALSPDNAEALNNLGLALGSLGRRQEAVAALRRAIALVPNFAMAYNNLGVALKDLGRYAEAEAALRRGLALDPDYVAVHNNLGDVLNTLGRYEEAATHLRRALELDPKCHEALNNLGVALSNLERPAEAALHLAQALELNPTYLPAHINLGNALVAQGRVEEGTRHFLKVLKLNPDFPGVYYALATNSRHRFSDDEMVRMEALLASGRLAAEDQTLLCFALAQTLEKTDRHDEAFRFCRQGNELRKASYRNQGIVFDPATHVSFVDGIIATFTPEFFQRVSDWGVDSELPLFVVGMPRSSTTLVEQIVSSHPDVFGAGELPDIERLVAALPATLGTTTRYPECLVGADAAVMRSLAEAHEARLRSLGGKAVRVVDKMTVNFLHLGVIAALFPKARVIHCRRNPRDIAVSCYFHNFARAGLAFTFDLEHLGVFYAQYERVMAHWRQVLPLPILDMGYEDLVRDQETQTRRLIDFCGLDWDPKCLAFHENNRPVKTASALQVRRPMYSSSIQRWKKFERYLKPFEDRAGIA